MHEACLRLFLHRSNVERAIIHKSATTRKMQEFFGVILPIDMK
jgi:hypothetical protein